MTIVEFINTDQVLNMIFFLAIPVGKITMKRKKESTYKSFFLNYCRHSALPNIPTNFNLKPSGYSCASNCHQVYLRTLMSKPKTLLRFVLNCQRCINYWTHVVLCPSFYCPLPVHSIFLCVQKMDCNNC